MLSSLILLIIFTVQAKDFYSQNNLRKESLDEPAISRKYFQGEHLIYDCETANFACVSSEGFKLCEGKRKSDLYLKKLNLRCAPLKKFENQKSCFKAQLKYIHQGRRQLFCR